MGEKRRTVYLAVVAAGLVIAAVLVRKPQGPPMPGKSGDGPKPFVLGQCPAPTGNSVPVVEQGDPRARAAAQRGLDFLAREALGWQGEHNCYGCHVHAVTLEAMVVGVHHQYNVPQDDMNALVDGMVHLSGGARDTMGFAYQHTDLLAPSKAFGGAAFARYDQLVRSDLQEDLVHTAEDLLKFQQEDGHILVGWTNGPVGAGEIQATYQATQTWRQAYARTADDKWLLPIQRAERYVRKQVADRRSTGGVNLPLQDCNYAMMALHEAGVGDGDDDVGALLDQVTKQQHDDGGWGLSVGNESGAFATGQTLYALRLLGRSDGDPVVKRGTEWLITHQNGDGGWSHTGFGKAEAMWAVLGLVSVDVLSLNVAGLQDGQHADGTLTLTADAKDNQAGGVSKVELSIDDVPTFGACGARLSYRWNSDGAQPGKHLVDVIATNAQGKTSRRRLEVYTGPTFLTQIGSRSADDGTIVTTRNIAPGKGGTVELQVLTVEDRGGTPVAGKQVASVTQGGAPGPASLFWNGRDEKGIALPKGRYLGRLVYRKDDKIVQSEEIPIVHDTVEAQANDYGQLEGALKLKGAELSNANVELVDHNGNVVQRSVSTASGKYRFKNVDGGDYLIRVAKPGFAPVMKKMTARKGKSGAADLDLD
jgi:squalene-hopene/tetraprenyl-beta-curcumene cyclase